MVSQQFMNGKDIAKCVQLASFVYLENPQTPISYCVRLGMLRKIILQTPFDKLSNKLIQEALQVILDVALEPSVRPYLLYLLEQTEKCDKEDSWVPRCRRLLGLIDQYYTQMREFGHLSPQIVDHQSKGLLFRLVEPALPYSHSNDRSN